MLRKLKSFVRSIGPSLGARGDEPQGSANHEQEEKRSAAGRGIGRVLSRALDQVRSPVCSVVCDTYGPLSDSQNHRLQEALEANIQVAKEWEPGLLDDRDFLTPVIFELGWELSDEKRRPRVRK